MAIGTHIPKLQQITLHFYFIQKENVSVRVRKGASDLKTLSQNKEKKWQPTPMFLPGESQGWGSLVGCHLWDLTESDTTDAT